MAQGGKPPRQPTPPTGFQSWNEETTDVREMMKAQAEALAKATVEAQAEAQAKAQEEQERQRLTLLYADLYGMQGQPGRLAIMEGKLAEQGKSIETLIEFRGRFLWVLGGLMTTGGVVAALAFKAIERWFSGHW